MTQQEELKPCLFCGSAAEDGMGYNYHKVCCSSLACRMSNTYFTKKEWNMRAKAQAVPQWIPVSERWPEYGEHVLMLIPTSINYVVAGFISCDEQEDEEGPFHTCSLCDQYGDDIGYSIECLSHWMPLPSAPEQNK